jgi:hypothetical protein
MFIKIRSMSSGIQGSLFRRLSTLVTGSRCHGFISHRELSSQQWPIKPKILNLSPCLRATKDTVRKKRKKKEEKQEGRGGTEVEKKKQHFGVRILDYIHPLLLFFRVRKHALLRFSGNPKTI